MAMEENQGLYLNIIITQGLCMLVVLLSVITIKYLFKSEFKVLQKWYIEEFCNDTLIEEVIE